MRHFKYILGSIAFIFFLTLTAYVGFRVAFRGLIFPKVRMAGIELTGMDKESSLKLVSSYFRTQPSEITLTMNGENINNLSGLAVNYDFNWAIEAAYLNGRKGNILTQVKEQLNTLINGREINIPLEFDREELNNLVGQIAEEQNQKPVWPKLIQTKGEITLSKGKDGIVVKTDDLTKEIVRNLVTPGKHIIEIPRVVVATKEDPELLNRAVEAMKKWGDNKLTVSFREFEKTLKREEMMNLFGLINEPVNEEIYEVLVKDIKPKMEVEARDAIFVFEDNRVKEFKPEIIGAVVDIPSFRNKLAEALLAGENKPLEIPVILSYPNVKAGDINDLGIRELIGTGKSTFAHSIPGRVFNVNLAASRVNGTLVAPGEEFSFNKAVGEISKATGYQSAYIISEGRTVLGDGGGVCQVSTTTFRAAMSAGLPITERKAHAYRVGYYEQDSAPGIDATVFSPSADLKFLNNTGHYILIQEAVDTKNLTMRVDIYGTSDGRKATTSKPRISSQTPPPPTVYVDDPTLPAGTMKQVDWSAWGAKVAFDYKVEKNGEVVYEKTFVSNYRPWQAVYMRGTGELAVR